MDVCVCKCDSDHRNTAETSFILFSIFICIHQHFSNNNNRTLCCCNSSNIIGSSSSSCRYCWFKFSLNDVVKICSMIAQHANPNGSPNYTVVVEGRPHTAPQAAHQRYQADPKLVTLSDSSCLNNEAED